MFGAVFKFLIDFMLFDLCICLTSGRLICHCCDQHCRDESDHSKCRLCLQLGQARDGMLPFISSLPPPPCGHRAQAFVFCNQEFLFQLDFLYMFILCWVAGHRKSSTVSLDASIWFFESTRMPTPCSVEDAPGARVLASVCTCTTLKSTRQTWTPRVLCSGQPHRRRRRRLLGLLLWLLWVLLRQMLSPMAALITSRMSRTQPTFRRGRLQRSCSARIRASCACLKFECRRAANRRAI